MQESTISATENQTASPTHLESAAEFDADALCEAFVWVSAQSLILISLESVRAPTGRGSEMCMRHIPQVVFALGLLIGR